MKKLRLIVVLAGMVLVQGCGHWSAKEKVLFGTMVAANVADYSTTIRYIDIGGTESNPFLDDRPSHGSVVTFKAISVGLSVLIGEIIPEQRANIFLFNTVISGGAAMWNDGLYEKYKY